MNRARGTAVVLGAFTAAACGGGTDYVGQPPAEASIELAERACGELFECGALTFTCDPPLGEYMPATNFYATEAACQGDLGDYYTDLLIGCAALGLTDDQATDLNDCFNYSAGCLSETELQEVAVAACADQPYGSEACFRSRATFTACSACADDPADPMCDGV
jgi:hypothetical protein